MSSFHLILGANHQARWLPPKTGRWPRSQCYPNPSPSVIPEKCLKNAYPPLHSPSAERSAFLGQDRHKTQIRSTFRETPRATRGWLLAVSPAACSVAMAGVAASWSAGTAAMQPADSQVGVPRPSEAAVAPSRDFVKGSKQVSLTPEEEAELDEMVQAASGPSSALACHGCHTDAMPTSGSAWCRLIVLPTIRLPSRRNQLRSCAFPGWPGAASRGELRYRGTGLARGVFIPTIRSHENAAGLPP